MMRTGEDVKRIGTATKSEMMNKTNSSLPSELRANYQIPRTPIDPILLA
jgi:hypothetical protein